MIWLGDQVHKLRHDIVAVGAWMSPGRMAEQGSAQR